MQWNSSFYELPVWNFLLQLLLNVGEFLALLTPRNSIATFWLFNFDNKEKESLLKGNLSWGCILFTASLWSIRVISELTVAMRYKLCWRRALCTILELVVGPRFQRQPCLTDQRQQVSFTFLTTTHGPRLNHIISLSFVGVQLDTMIPFYFQMLRLKLLLKFFSCFRTQQP